MIAALVVLAGFLAGYGVALRRLRSRRPAALPFDPRVWTARRAGAL